jgi:hypothetical protein
MAIVVDVPAKAMWQATPVQVQPGDTLHFQASGRWFDAVIGCSADGYSAPLFYGLNVLPRIPDDGRYFRLMGRIVEDGVEPQHDDVAETFAIGSQATRTFARAGELFVFANDHKGAYWNNWGSVTLTIEKQTPAGSPS